MEHITFTYILYILKNTIVQLLQIITNKLNEHQFYLIKYIHTKKLVSVGISSCHY